MKKRIGTMVLAVSLVLQLLTQIVIYAGTDVITVMEESFENGMDEWFLDNKSGKFEITDTKAYDGEKSLHISVDESNKNRWNKIKRTVAVEKGETYVLTYNSWFESGTVFVDYVDAALSSEKNASTQISKHENTWTYHVVQFTASSDTVTIGFGNKWGELLEAYVDDIKIVKVDKVPGTFYNGSFNDVGIGGWTVNNKAFYTPVNDPVYEGEHALKININSTNKNNWNKISQVVDVEVGTEYRMSYYSKFVGGLTFCDYVSEKPNTTVNANHYTNAYKTYENDWTYHEILFTATKPQVTIAFGNYWGQELEAYIDDVQLIKRKPTVISSDVYGYAAAGNVLTAVDEVIDLYGDNVEVSTYQWQVKTGSSWTDITNANEKNYTVSKDDEGKYLRVAITPVSSDAKGNMRYGDDFYTRAVMVEPVGTYFSVDISKLFNTMAIGTSKEAVNGQNKENLISSGLLRYEGIKLNESNAMIINSIPYAVIMNGEKRAVKSNSDSLEIDLGDKYYGTINVLMTYSEELSEKQTAVITYADGTEQTTEYNPGIFAERTDCEADVSDCIGAYNDIGVSATVNEKTGYLYSYSFNVDEVKPIKSIAFSGAENKQYVFAVTGANLSSDKLIDVIENKLAVLPETITLNDKAQIDEIRDLIEIYTGIGGKTDEIKGVEKYQRVAIAISDITANAGLFDFKINVDFTNYIKEDSITLNNFYIEGIDTGKYEIIGENDGNGIKRVVIKLVNYFDYPEIKVVVNNGVTCANSPYFTLDEGRTFIYQTEELLEFNNLQATVNGGTVKLTGSVKNNSADTQSYCAVGIVYSAEGEPVSIVMSEDKIGAGESRQINETASTVVTENAVTKVFALEDVDNMNVVKGITEKSKTVENESFSYDALTETFTICGYNIGKKANVPVSVKVLNPDNTVQFIDTMCTGENGSYNVKFKLHKDGKEDYGNYKVIVGGYGYDAPQKAAEIYVADQDEINRTILYLNNANYEDIDKYSKILHVNFELFDNAEPQKLAELIKNESKVNLFKEDDLQDTLERLRQIAIVAAYNEGSKGKIYSSSEGILFADEMKFDELDTKGETLYSVFKTTITDEGKEALVNAMINQKFSTVNEWYDTFREQMMLKTISYPNVLGIEYVGKLLTKENAAAVKLDADKYFKLSDKTKVNADIARKSFTTIDELSKKINVSNESSGTGSENTGSSGRGNGKGSGSNIAIGTEIVNPDKNTTSAQKMFSDVPQEHWAYKAIYRLKEMGILSGKTETEFVPDEAVTREQFVKMLCIALNIPNTNEKYGFADVQSGAWYEQYVNSAYEKEIINGIGDSTFGIGQNITRQDVCTMVCRATELAKDENAEAKEFGDAAEIAEYAREAVDTLSRIGIMNGFEDGTFRPADNCTRAQAAKIIYEIIRQ